MVLSNKRLDFHCPSLSHNYSLCQEPEALNCLSRSLGNMAFQVFHGSLNDPWLSRKKKIPSLEKIESPSCLWLVTISQQLLQKVDQKRALGVICWLLALPARELSLEFWYLLSCSPCTEQKWPRSYKPLIILVSLVQRIRIAVYRGPVFLINKYV